MITYLILYACHIDSDCLFNDTVPSAPLDFIVSDVTPFSIEVSWSPPASNGSMDIVQDQQIL